MKTLIYLFLLVIFATTALYGCGDNGNWDELMAAQAAANANNNNNTAEEQSDNTLQISPAAVAAIREAETIQERTLELFKTCMQLKDCPGIPDRNVIDTFSVQSALVN